MGLKGSGVRVKHLPRYVSRSHCNNKIPMNSVKFKDNASQGLPYASNNCTMLSEKNTFKHFHYTRNKFFKERFFLFLFLKRLTKCWTSKGKSQTLTPNMVAVEVNIHMTSSINNSFREHIAGFNPKM